MKISLINNSLINKELGNKTTEKNNTNFGDVLKNEINKVNNLQIKADEATQDLMTGKAENIHSVMVATEEARLALEMTVQIRNKVIEAYQEINRMQI